MAQMGAVPAQQIDAGVASAARTMRVQQQFVDAITSDNVTCAVVLLSVMGPLGYGAYRARAHIIRLPIRVGESITRFILSGMSYVVPACLATAMIAGSYHLWFVVHPRLYSLIQRFSLKRCYQKLVHKFSIIPDPDRVNAIREVFLREEIEKCDVSGSNPHGMLAAQRTSAQDAIKSISVKTNHPLFKQQPRRSEVAMSDGRYFLEHQNLDDLTINPTIMMPVFEGHCVQMVDCNITEEVLFHYAYNNNIICIFTILPTRLTVSTKEEMSRFDENGFYLMSIAGGKTLKLELFDYNLDLIYLRSPLRLHSVLCYVHIKDLGQNRGLVLLVPKVIMPVKATLLNMFTFYWESDYPTLRRLNPVLANGNLMLTTFEGVNISRVGRLTDALVTHEQHSELVSLKNLSANPFEGSSLKITNNDKQIKLIREFYHNYKTDGPLITIRDVRKTSYNVVYSDIPTDDQKDKSRTFMVPIINDSYSPVSSMSNDICCVKQRVINPRFNKTVPAKYNDMLLTFAEQLKAEVGQLYPMTIEEVIENCNSQKLRKYMHCANEGDLEDSHKAFQKTEAYPEAKAPRNISAVDTNHVIQWLQYWKPLAKRLIEVESSWYAFGRTPFDTAQLVHNVAVASDEEYLIETDFSKFDGTQGRFIRDIELAVLYTLYPESEHTRIMNLASRLNWQRMTTEWRIVYNTGDSRLSGSADTSTGNTVINKFTSYASGLNCGLTPAEAYNIPGVYGGDDGLAVCHNVQIYEQTVDDLGLKLKAAVRKRGDSVSFLARIFHDPWNSCSSFFDPVRCLSKLHFTHQNNPKVSSAMILAEKGASLYVTEGGLLRIIGRLMMEKSKQTTVQIKGEGKFHSIEADHCMYDKYQVTEFILKFSTPLYPSSDFPLNETFWYLFKHGNTVDHIVCAWDSTQYFCERTGLNIDEFLYWLHNWDPLVGPTLFDEEKVTVCDTVNGQPSAIEIDHQVIGKVGPSGVDQPNIDVVKIPYCCFLRKCRKQNCPMVHEVRPGDCVAFVKGRCTFTKCKWNHDVKVSSVPTKKELGLRARSTTHLGKVRT